MATLSDCCRLHLEQGDSWLSAVAVCANALENLRGLPPWKKTAKMQIRTKKLVSRSNSSHKSFHGSWPWRIYHGVVADRGSSMGDWCFYLPWSIPRAHQCGRSRRSRSSSGQRDSDASPAATIGPAGFRRGHPRADEYAISEPFIRRGNASEQCFSGGHARFWAGWPQKFFNALQCKRKPRHVENRCYHGRRTRHEGVPGFGVRQHSPTKPLSKPHRISYRLRVDCGMF
jgi:hypothetical protein